MLRIPSEEAWKEVKEALELVKTPEEEAVPSIIALVSIHSASIGQVGLVDPVVAPSVVSIPVVAMTPVVPDMEDSQV